jgi:hypothetical protein
MLKARLTKGVSTRSKRMPMNASHTNHIVVVARVAAPSPRREKTTPAAIAAGTAKRVGSHAPRHAGRRRNANDSTSGAAERRSHRESRFHLVCGRVPRIVLATSVDSATVKAKNAVEERADPSEDKCACSDPA